MRPGLAAAVRLTLNASVFAKFKRVHRMTVTVRTVAHDGARRPHNKTRTLRVTLIYRAS